MKLKDILKHILVTAFFVTLSSGAVNAQDSDVTDAIVPKQYPAKYTPAYIKQITPSYKCVGKDEIFYVALDMLKETSGMFSRNAILGSNLSQRPVQIEFKDLVK